jgi:cytidylate kinase
MIITISGVPGSGKSSVAKIIAAELGYERLYIGGLQREMAKQRGITLEQISRLEESDPSVDRELDLKIREAAEKNENIVIESRTAAGLFRKWKIRKKAVHILLKCDLVVSAQRIFEQKKREGCGRRNERFAETEKEQLLDIKERMASESKRYKKYYGFDCYDERLYDLIVDTTRMTIEKAADAVLGFIKTRSQIRSPG